MPTTKEFGPNGSLRRLGGTTKRWPRGSVCRRIAARENRFNQNSNPAADNYQVRLADSLLLFSSLVRSRPT